MGVGLGDFKNITVIVPDGDKVRPKFHRELDNLNLNLSNLLFVCLFDATEVALSALLKSQINFCSTEFVSGFPEKRS